MDNLIVADTRLFLFSVILGFFFGVYYEVFRFLRIAFFHKKIAVIVEDLIFWIPLPFCFLIFIWAFSDGVIRWFSLFGTLVGFITYLGTFGQIALRFSQRIIKIVRGILRFVYHKTIQPFYNVFKNITITLFTRTKKLVILLKMKIEVASLKRKKKRFLVSASRGFGR